MKDVVSLTNGLLLASIILIGAALVILVEGVWRLNVPGWAWALAGIALGAIFVWGKVKERG